MVMMPAMKLLLLVATISMHAAVVLAKCNSLIRDIKFSKDLDGVYTEAALQRDFDGYHYFKGIEDHTATIQSYEGTKYLCLKMKRGCVSTHGRRCGIVGRVPINGAPQSATLEYTVRFGSGFDWNKGGKLLGMCSGECPTGCSRVSAPSEGFSVRAMWGSGGMLYLYSYAMGLETGGKCGNDTMPASAVQMEPGKDYRVRLIARMNDIGESNGKLEMWLQGKRMVAIPDLRLRSSEKQGVDDFLFHTFFGGNSDDWAAPKDEDIMYKDIKLYNGDCGGDESADSGPAWTSKITDASSSGSSLSVDTRLIGTWGGQFCVKYYVKNSASSICDKYSMDVSMNPSLGYLGKFLSLETIERSEEDGWYKLQRKSSFQQYLNPGVTREGSLCVQNSRKSRYSADTILRDFKVSARCDTDSATPDPPSTPPPEAPSSTPPQDGKITIERKSSDYWGKRWKKEEDKVHSQSKSSVWSAFYSW